MQSNVKILLFILLAVGIAACERVQGPMRHDNPNWTFVAKPDYSVSMTAAIVLPANLNPYLSDNDLIVALMDDEVRGVGRLYEGIFYIQIQAADDEIGEVSFMYWNAKTQYMYKAEQVFPFKENDMLGTPDAPMTLTFKVI